MLTLLSTVAKTLDLELYLTRIYQSELEGRRDDSMEEMSAFRWKNAPTP